MTFKSKIFFDKLSNLSIWSIFPTDLAIALFLYEWGNATYKIRIKYGYKPSVSQVKCDLRKIVIMTP